MPSFLQVYAIVVSKPRLGELSPASVSYTAGFYHTPVIGISSRDSAFSDKARVTCGARPVSALGGQNVKLISTCGEAGRSSFSSPFLLLLQSSNGSQKKVKTDKVTMVAYVVLAIDFKSEVRFDLSSI